MDSASVDLEWISYKGKYHHSKTKIYAAAFCTNWGERIVLHISKYKAPKYPNPEKALIQQILFYFNQFSLTFGWYTTGITVYDEKTGERLRGRDSDFYILHQRCMFYNLESPFELGYSGRYITLKRDSKSKHIDLIKVFEKQAIEDNVFGGRYRTPSLEAVSLALLGITKYENINAGSINILERPIEEQKKYVRRDAELVMLLAQYNNCLVLRLMKVFSRYAEMDYYKVCHTGVGNWYENKYKKMLERGEITVKFTPNYKLEKEEFTGGHQITPKKGFFVNSVIIELDVKGMYPAIGMNNNLSFDTLNCICCEYDSSCQICKETIETINRGLQKKKTNRRVSKLWVCKKRRGALPLVLEQVLADRHYYLEKFKEEKSKTNPNIFLLEEYDTHQIGAKIFANAGYGLFGTENFDFSNYKVAECITAEGRRIHKQMELIAKQQPFNFDIVFGFTDSIFVRVDTTGPKYGEEKIREFIERCKKELGMTVEIKNVFVNSILYGEMNRLVGWSGKEKDEPLIKGLDGLAYTNPLWVKKWVFKVINEIIKKPESRFEIIPRLLDEAVFDLKHNICVSEENMVKQLVFTQKLSKYPNEYHKSNRTGLLGRLLERDKGEEVWWYEIIGIDAETKDGFSTSVPKPETVNIKKYKKLLFEKLKDTLEITGFKVEKIRLQMIDGITPLI
jgi:DNA polymerase elongation subunit (family B)